MATVKISALPEVSATNDVALAGVEAGTTKKMSGSVNSTQVITALGFTPAPINSPAFTGVPTTTTPALHDNSTKIANTAWVIGEGYITASTAPVTSVAGKTGVVTLVVGDISGAAPLVSPTFTGTPVAPTPTLSDNTTKLATTAFIKGQEYQPGLQFKDEGSNIGTPAGETIVNFTGAGVTASESSGTITVNIPGTGTGTVTSIGISTGSSGVSITGSPVTSSGTIDLALGTAANHDVPASGNAGSSEVVLGNDTRLGAGAGLVGINDQTGTTYTLVLADASKDVRCTNASAIALTVPPNSSVAFSIGTVIIFSQGGVGAVTATAGAGVTLNAANGIATTAIYDFRGLEYLGSDIWRVC